MYSVAEAIPELRIYAGDSGACSDETTIEYINKARRCIWNKADNAFNTGYYCISCVDGCVTLPSEIEQVRLAWFNGMPVPIGNEWYSSVPQVGFPRQNSCHEKFTQVGARTVTFQNYTYGNYQIALQAESPLDIGKQLTIEAVDRYGTRKKDTISLLNPPEYALSTDLYKGVVSVVKPRTSARVRMYAYDPNNGKKLLLAVYQPYDVNPYFLQYASNPCNKCLIVYAKKKFYTVTEGTDLLEYTLEALIHAMQAVVCRENKNQNDQFAENMQLAMAEINRDTADREQDVGSPLRIFLPDAPHALINGYGGWNLGGSYGSLGWGGA